MTDTEREAREWQLDQLRALRNERLAYAEALRREAWDLYNSACEALSETKTEAGA